MAGARDRAACAPPNFEEPPRAIGWLTANPRLAINASISREAQAKAKVAPHAVANDLGRNAMTTLRGAKMNSFAIKSPMH